MSKDILGTLIRRLVTVPAHMLGTLADLAQKLAGSNGEEWLSDLKSFLRKESFWQTIPSRYFRNRNGLRVTDDFKNRILSIAEPAFPATIGRPFHLNKTMSSLEICEALGEDHVFKSASEFCAMLSNMLEAQWDGGFGQLLTGGSENVFHVLGVDDKTFSVAVYWNNMRDYWFVGAFELDVHRGSFCLIFSPSKINKAA